MYFHFPTFFRALRLTFSRRHFAPRHAFLALLFVAMFLALRLFVALFRLLDHVLFPGFRRQELRSPVFILANPRSGTTFLHRLMSLDDQFTHINLWHSMFPSVTLYRIFGVFGALHRRIGRPFEKWITGANRAGFRGWEEIHRTHLGEAEEDEQLFVFAMLSPILALLFPYLDQLPYAKFPDRLPERSRRRLMAYWVSSMKRHVYATGRNRILLAKNTLMTGRLRSALEAIPDMRVVHLVRHPYRATPSLVSMFSAPWAFFRPRARQDPDACRAVARMLFDFYHYFEELKKEIPEERFLEVLYEDLVADPRAVVERVYDKFDLRMTEDYRRALREEAGRSRTYKSRHVYRLEDVGLTRGEVYASLRPIFERYGFEP